MIQHVNVDVGSWTRKQHPIHSFNLQSPDKYFSVVWSFHQQCIYTTVDLRAFRGEYILLFYPENRLHIFSLPKKQNIWDTCWIQTKDATAKKNLLYKKWFSRMSWCIIMQLCRSYTGIILQLGGRAWGTTIQSENDKILSIRMLSGKLTRILYVNPACARKKSICPWNNKTLRTKSFGFQGIHNYQQHFAKHIPAHACLAVRYSNHHGLVQLCSAVPKYTKPKSYSYACDLSNEFAF